MGGAVAFILKGYPRLSETFIAQELAALEKRGLEIRIVSLRHPTDTTLHPVHQEISTPVCYLPEYLYQEPLRVLRSWRAARRLPRYREMLRLWWRDFKRDPTANRIRRLGQALVLANELGADIIHLHAHFLHTPGSVARYTSVLTGRPWSFSAHAKDIWTSPDWEKSEKLSHCDWAVTCTSVNHQHLQSLTSHPERIDLLYHGLDLQRFPPPPPGSSIRSGGAPVVLLSVGRAVDKKGYHDLLDALALLPPSLDWRFVHIGAGPLLSSLKARASKLGIDENITWLGPLSQTEVLRHYTQADLFVLASRVSSDGDRDGLPNVLMEAQSQGLACLSTQCSAIPELIDHEVSGILVPERNPPALARALEQLIGDPALRQKLGEAGNVRVRAEFSLDVNIERLVTKFQQALGPARPPV